MRARSGAPRSPTQLLEQLISFDAPPKWLLRHFGLKTNQLPNRIRLPHVQPVTELYHPRLTVITYTGATPGGFTIQLPDIEGVEWELLCMEFKLTTNVVAGNRIVTVQDLTSGYIACANKTHAASIACEYSFAPTGVIGETSSTPGAGGINHALIPSPVGLRLPSKGSLLVSVSAFDAGDVIGAITLTLLRRATSGFDQLALLVQ